jgi:copper chaperone CopZ
MQTMSFDIRGMNCGGCTASVQHAIGRLAGVVDVTVTLRPGVATVRLHPDRVKPEQIVQAVAKRGFASHARDGKTNTGVAP